MYKILLLDDRPPIRIVLADKLREHDIEVFSCRSVYEADFVWAAKKDELDAIVLDMMMPSLGLCEELRSKTNGGLLTGWVWLWYHLNPMNMVPHPAANKRIVIYSAYLADFYSYVTSEQASEDEKEFLLNVKMISKDIERSEHEVIEYLVKAE